MSRQFEHYQEASLKQLQAMVPHDCPLLVRRLARGRSLGGFVVTVLDTRVGCSGRFQVVAAWVEGYVTAWKAQG
jgi:hypothetical protein